MVFAFAGASSLEDFFDLTGPESLSFFKVFFDAVLFFLEVVLASFLIDSDLDDEVFFDPSSFLISSKDLEVFSFLDFLDIIKNLYSKITTEIKQ